MLNMALFQPSKNHVKTHFHRNRALCSSGSFLRYEASKALDSFNVSAKCAEGYKGRAGPCGHH